jgi:menaquinone-dependent protoporphyrinogen oxidase
VKVLIAYCTRYGTTADRARSIAAAVRAQVDLVDLVRDPNPDPAGYGAVLIGGSIYGGRIQARVGSFCERHEETLRKTPTGVFVCCLSRGAHARSQLQEAFPDWLLQTALCRSLPGGALHPGRLRLLDRFLVRSVPHPRGEVDMRDEQEIAAAAEAVNALIRP